MLACNVLTVEEVWRAIDFDTILLLFGMMIVAANLRISDSSPLPQTGLSGTRTTRWRCSRRSRWRPMWRGTVPP